MEEKRYLKGYQKIAYGLGDFGGNFCYTFVASFVLGKAKPWLYMSFVPLGITVLLEFVIPDMDQTLQYAYFFVVYTLMNSIFFTIYNIAYNTLTALITKNNTERVQLGVWRYVFALAAAMGISTVTPLLVTSLGGGASAWRIIAFAYTVILLVTCGISTPRIFIFCSSRPNRS